MAELDSRRVALEESFFAEENQKLLEQFRAKQDRSDHIKQMTETFSYIDETYAGKLFDSGIKVETLAAVSLLPLVQVAWADGEMDAKESDALKKAASESGLKGDGMKLMDQWIASKPSADMFGTWTQYIKGLKTDMNGQDYNALQSKVMDQVKNVAQSAGGFMGLKSVSSEEQEMIEKIEGVFLS